ncbi:alpha/beta hydrolase [Bradyrhizobium sp. 10BB]|nr:alpha/beta hydrolase [Bradyrhizobium acaciae]
MHAQASEQAPSGPPAGLPTDFDTQFTHRYAEANGVRLHYVVGGPVDGPVIVLLHGWPQTWYTWRNVMPKLASAGYRVVAVDYRGAGQSEKTASGYDKAAMAADIRALVQSLGVSNVNLVGRDIGVMIAYAYAAQWPDGVKTLTMLDVPIPATPAWNEAKHKPDPDIWHFGFFQRPDVPELLIAGHEFAFIRDFIHVREYRPILDDDIRVYADAYAAAGGLRAGFELYRAFPQDEQRFAEFEKTKLPMPVLALAGDKSNGTVELTMAQRLASDVSGGTAPETGHWLPDENPVFLSAQLVSFLRAHDR